MEVEGQEDITDLQKSDTVMYFDPEFDVWFKYKLLKVTQNYYVLGAIAWDNHDLKPCVKKTSDQLESENDSQVIWKKSSKMHGAFERLSPPNIPPSVQDMREAEEKETEHMEQD